MKECILNINRIDIIIKTVKSKIETFDNDCIVLLRGDLASGKTTFVKNYVQSLGLDDLVTSPTFSIQSIYSNRIFHYDIYNKTVEEFIALGLLEEFEKNGVHFIEWADDKLEKLLKSYGYNVMLLEIKKYDDKRLYILHE